MKIDNLIEGLQIIRKYDDNPDSGIGSEGGICIGSYDQLIAAMSAAEVKRMEDLGWSEDEYGSFGFDLWKDQ